MSNTTGTPFNTYATLSTTGIACKSYSTDTAATQSQGTNYLGEFFNNFAINPVMTMSFQGEITGSSPTGICLCKVGANFGSPPSGLWTNNQVTIGTSLICESAKADFKAGAPAEFSASFKKYENF